MLIDGCQDGKHTPRLVEVLCPKCGEIVDVFVQMGGMPGLTGTLVSSEVCVCGHVLEMGTYLTEFEEA